MVAFESRSSFSRMREHAYHIRISLSHARSIPDYISPQIVGSTVIIKRQESWRPIPMLETIYCSVVNCFLYVFDVSLYMMGEPAELWRESVNGGWAVRVMAWVCAWWVSRQGYGVSLCMTGEPAGLWRESVHDGWAGRVMAWVCAWWVSRQGYGVSQCMAGVPAGLWREPVHAWRMLFESQDVFHGYW